MFVSCDESLPFILTKNLFGTKYYNRIGRLSVAGIDTCYEGKYWRGGSVGNRHHISWRLSAAQKSCAAQIENRVGAIVDAVFERIFIKNFICAQKARSRFAVQNVGRSFS